MLANDAGTPPLIVDDVTQPAHGTATCSPAGQCSYEPEAGFSGNDGFRYTIRNSDDLRSTAEVHVTVAPASAAFGVSVSGSPDPLTSGTAPSWGVGVTGVPAGAGDDALDALARPSVTATLSGAHTIKPGSVTTAPGWSAGQVTGASASAHADSSAMLGEADTQLLAKPLPPTSQGTGGDGYVPILVGSKVFAFFHHSHPTSVTCIDRTTGSRCPGYPIRTNMNTTDRPGPGAVVGNRIYVTLQPRSNYSQTAPLGLYCWDAAAAEPCGYVVVRRFRTTSNPSASGPVVVGGKVYVVGDGGKLYCVDPATNVPCTTPAISTGLDGDLGGSYDITSHGSRVFVSRYADKVACIDVRPAPRAPAGRAPSRCWTDRWNVVNRFNAQGQATGVCLVTIGSGVCYDDNGQPRPRRSDGCRPVGIAIDTEAETGSRTLVAGDNSGVACWDWVTLAPCTGGDYDQGGRLLRDVGGESLPWAYGTAFDGSCVLGLGDPGLVFSVDPKGSSPCSSLGPATRTLDLRKQRCDGGVGQRDMVTGVAAGRGGRRADVRRAHRARRRERRGARHEGHLERPARPQRDRCQGPSRNHRRGDGEERARRHGVGRRGAAAHPGRLARRPPAAVLRDDDGAVMRGRARVGEGGARRRLRDQAAHPYADRLPRAGTAARRRR